VRTPNREVLQPSYVIVGRQSSDGIHFLVDPPHTQGKKNDDGPGVNPRCGEQ
jgi:hypothetical protein